MILYQDDFESGGEAEGTDEEGEDGEEEDEEQVRKKEHQSWLMEQVQGRHKFTLQKQEKMMKIAESLFKLHIEKSKVYVLYIFKVTYLGTKSSF